MPITLQNALPTTLDIPGAGLLFAPGEHKTVDALNPALANAVQRGALTVVSQTHSGVIVVAEDGQNEFALPVFWPGPDRMQVALNGLVLAFGEDFTVDPATNVLSWLDEDITLKTGDRITLIGGGA
jgi:hypothetical protein